MPLFARVRSLLRSVTHRAEVERELSDEIALAACGAAVALAALLACLLPALHAARIDPMKVLREG